MRRASRSLGVAGWLVGWLIASACLQPDSIGPGIGSGPGGSCPGCHRGSGAGGAATGGGVGGTSGGAASSGGGTTSSGGGSGTSGGSTGAYDAGPCTGYRLTSVLEDSDSLITSNPQPIGGADVSALSVDGVPIAGESALSGASGEFSLCATSQQFTTEVQATGYATSYLEDLALTADTSVVAIPLNASGTVMAYSLVLSGFVTTDSVIVGEVISASGQPPCNDTSGWALSAILPDGGALPFLTAYIGSDKLPHTYLTSTTSLVDNGVTVGIGFLYNLNPTLTGAVQIIATQVDGGSGCSVNDGGPFTGRVVIGQGSFSFAPLILP